MSAFAWFGLGFAACLALLAAAAAVLAWHVSRDFDDGGEPIEHFPPRAPAPSRSGWMAGRFAFSGPKLRASLAPQPPVQLSMTAPADAGRLLRFDDEAPHARRRVGMPRGSDGGFHA